jgi:hypothetical protein
MQRQIRLLGSTTSPPASTPYATQDHNLDLILLIYTPAPSPLHLRPAIPAERRKEQPGEEGKKSSCSEMIAGWGGMRAELPLVAGINILCFFSLCCCMPWRSKNVTLRNTYVLKFTKGAV